MQNERPKEFEGILHAEGMRFALVVSRFNALVTESLLAGALDCLKRHGATVADQVVVRVPGGWEIGLAVQHILKSQQLKVHGIIALGCVMRGSTTHNEYINGELTKQLSHLSLEHHIPVSFGVLTPDTMEQALERSGLKMGNKGAEAAEAGIEMVSLLRRLG
ncbi:MAG: 6,7-dimethyl-8-ribityllumazine synthase [Candidatus Sumerlaeia bacterium]|nr:6,7-dimethyl-8-ribityllumazine synthase [Candidatus Sumerlaeia bacterium]